MGGSDAQEGLAGGTRKGGLTSSTGKRRLLAPGGVFLLFVAAGVLLYGKVILSGPFLFDDFEYIVGNPMVRNLSYFTNISEARYFGYLSFAVNYALGGENPVWFHLTNVLIHIINALLVFALTKRVLALLSREGEGDPGGHAVVAFFTGLVFLVHPVETQAVSYITQRFTSLCSLFYLLSVVLYLEARARIEERREERGPGFALYISSVAAAVLAMKTKEIAFTAPFMIAILELLLFAGSKYEKRRFYFLIPFAATLVIIPLSLFGPRLGLAAPGVAIDEITRRNKLYDLFRRSPYEYLVTQFRVIVTYIRLLVFPAGQRAVYDYPASRSFLEPRVLLSAAGLLAAGGAALYSWRRAEKAQAPEAAYYRLFSIGVIWFFVTISVESSVIPIKDLIFEHRAYLPSAGFFASCTALLVLAARKIQPGADLRKKAAALVLLIALPLSAATYARNIVWTDELKFWDDVVRKTGKAIGYNNRGSVYSKRGEYGLALRDLNRVIGAFPRPGGRLSWEGADFTPSNMAKTYVSRGQVYEKMGDTKRAEEDFAAARRLLLDAPADPAGPEEGTRAAGGQKAATK
ncbi:MAG: tetratricopeptide repeat protein [Nitrospiraceae bacterium]|nr:tetratricopeptide repeat protein [Nitrospiraceae bacterium]